MIKQKITKVLSTTLLFVVVSASVLAPLAQAQGAEGTWWNPSPTQFLNKVENAAENEIFGERYTYAQVNWIIHSLVSILSGPVAGCASSDGSEADCLEALASSRDAGAILPIAMGIDMFQTTKPASGIDYVAGKLERFNIVDTAYAQEGFGFSNSLQMVQPLWAGLRDASYSLVIFTILILAFMVMLRAKISPQASITVQSALPRVALGLVMITFSYAIAGFLVDLTFVLMGLMSGILDSSSIVSESGHAIDIFRALNNSAASMLSYMLGVFFVLLPLFGAAIGAAGFTALVSGGTLLPFFAGAIVASVVVLLILLIVLLIALVRIFWLQLKTFTTIILLVAVSPLIMLAGIVKTGTISGWLKSMVAQLSVFFTISTMILIAHIMLFSTNTGKLNQALIKAGDWLLPGRAGLNVYRIEANVNPEVGFFPSGFGFGSVGILGLFVSLGVILSIPKLANAARDSIMSGRMGGFGFDSTGTMVGATGVGRHGYQAGSVGAEAMANRAASKGGEGAGRGWSALSKGIKTVSSQK